MPEHDSAGAPLEGASASGRPLAVLRLVLGFAQMFGAVFSGVLLVATGGSRVTFAAVSATCLLTLLSRLLFRRR